MDNTFSLINAFSEAKVLLIGDTIVDHYIYGTALGLSSETPTLVAKELSQQFSLGGSFLVARNLLHLKAQVTFITLVGHDPEAKRITEFSHAQLKLLPITDEERKTTVKRRYWIDGYKLLQLDQLDNRPIVEQTENHILSILDEQLQNHNALLISDYRHGLLTQRLITEMIGLAKRKKVPVYVDSQVAQSKANHHLYQGATLVCLNKKEAQSIDPSFFDDRSLGSTTFEKIRETLAIDNVVIKLGPQGSIAHIKGEFIATPAFNVKAVDTCGAGDAFLAALSVCDLGQPEKALKIANGWAGLSTQIHGPQPPDLVDLLPLISE